MTRLKAPHRAVRVLIRLAQEQGWQVERTGSGHLAFTPPDTDQRPVTVSATPSDRRSLLNSAAQLRRFGLVIPRKGDRK